MNPVPDAPTQEFLRDLWKTLNTARREAGLIAYPYSFLAEIASNPEIPGDTIKLSRATVYSVMRGTYTSATAPAIRKRLADCINIKLQDLLTVHPALKGSVGTAKQQALLTTARESSTPARKKTRRRTPIIIRRRCSLQGYITWHGNTYYLGSAFAGESCTISPLRDRAHGIRVATAHASRNAHPIDPSNNQFGYQVQN